MARRRSKRKGNITLVGTFLDNLRKQQGYTWDTLAEAMHIDPSTVSRILQGKTRHPARDIIERLCDVLHIEDEALREAVYNSYGYLSVRQEEAAEAKIRQAIDTFYK